MRTLRDPDCLLAEGLEALRQQFQVPASFPPEVLAAAEVAARRLPTEHADWTDRPFVTLDPADSTDLDQAFAIEAAGRDWVLHYAIADVGWFVSHGDPIDAEAWTRGVTTYLPDGKAGLYPPILAEGAASLLPNGPRPAVVFSPTRSFHAAGILTEPPVSDPIAAGASPNATEAAAPEEDPPATAPSSFTQGGVAVTGFRPNPEKANSDIWVLPRQTRPPCVATSRTSASWAGTRPFSSADPASVATPAVSNRSFQLIGTPSSRPRRNPRRARPCAAIASARARAAVVRA